MELTPLKYFVAVAEWLHFGRAARMLHVSQPPLSLAIRKLEEELGVRLFERTSRSVALTDAGRELLTEARIILSRAEHAAGRMAALASGGGGKLVIAYNEPALNTMLPEALFRFRRHYPGVDLELREMEPEDQLSALRAGSIDVGFLRPFRYDLGEFNAQLVYTENYALAFPPGHPLGKVSESGLLAALDREPLLIFARAVNPALFEAITAAFYARNVFPEFREFAHGKGSLLALARAGFGAALVPESSSRTAGPGLEFRAFPAILPPVEIFAVRHPAAAHPAAVRFTALLERH